jgi:hypothetical protein
MTPDRQRKHQQRLTSLPHAENLSTRCFANPPPLASISKRNDTRHVVLHARNGRIPSYRVRFAPLTLSRPPAFDLVINREGLRNIAPSGFHLQKVIEHQHGTRSTPSIAQQHFLSPSGGLVVTFLATVA